MRKPDQFPSGTEGPAADPPPTLDRVMGRVRAYRRHRNLGVKDYARLAGIGGVAMSAIEHGKPVYGVTLAKAERPIPGDFRGYVPPEAGPLRSGPKPGRDRPRGDRRQASTGDLPT